MKIYAIKQKKCWSWTMKNIRKSDIQEYSILDKESTNDKGTIGGSTEKQFVRLDSSLLKGYLKEAIKRNTHYVTYIDDFVKENFDKESKDIPLKYVSILLKQARMGIKETVIKEVLGSRLTNLMGFPTVYNDMTSIDKDDYLVSIDFLKFGQEIEILDNKTQIDDFSTFSAWEKLIDINFNEIIDDANPNKEKIIDKFKRDFVHQYILKSLIFDDMDFYPRNVVYIKEEKSDGNCDYYLAPLLDYEFIFSFRRKDLMDRDCRENIEYLLKNYPQEISSFIATLEKNLYENGVMHTKKVDKIFKDVLKDDTCYNGLKTRFLQNIDRFHAEFCRQSNKMQERTF